MSTPVVEKSLALSSVVDTAGLIANGANRNGLDQSTAGEEIKDLPYQLGWPEEVTREGLASGGTEETLLECGGVALGSKVEELNVAELKFREVGQDAIGQLHDFGLIVGYLRVVIRYRENYLRSRGDSGLVGSCWGLCWISFEFM